MLMNQKKWDFKEWDAYNKGQTLKPYFFSDPNLGAAYELGTEEREKVDYDLVAELIVESVNLSELLALEYIIDLEGVRITIPVIVIANNRAAHFVSEFDNIRHSLAQDTIPLFLDDRFEIENWAKNNMDWCEVKQFATFQETDTKVNNDYSSEVWSNGEVELC